MVARYIIEVEKSWTITPGYWVQVMYSEIFILEKLDWDIREETLDIEVVSCDLDINAIGE